MSQDILALAIQHGLLLVFVNVFLEQIGLPVPAAPLLVVVGGLASVGQFSMLGAVVAAIAANLFGDGERRRWRCAVFQLRMAQL